MRALPFLCPEGTKRGCCKIVPNQEGADGNQIDDHLSLLVQKNKSGPAPRASPNWV